MHTFSETPFNGPFTHITKMSSCITNKVIGKNAYIFGFFFFFFWCAMFFNVQMHKGADKVRVRMDNLLPVLKYN